MKKITHILEFLKELLGLTNTGIATVLLLGGLVYSFYTYVNKTKFEHLESKYLKNTPLYQKFNVTTEEYEDAEVTERIIEASVLKDSVPARLIGYFSSQTGKEVMLDSPVTTLPLKVRNEPFLSLNVLLYDDNRWLLDSYDQARGIILENLDLRINTTIISKSNIKTYTDPNGRMCADYVFRLSDIK